MACRQSVVCFLVSLLQAMGWSEGQGLGRNNQGITAPIEVCGVCACVHSRMVCVCVCVHSHVVCARVCVVCACVCGVCVCA